MKHERRRVGGTASAFSDTRRYHDDFYVVTVTNRSSTRDIVVTRVWLDTVPPVDVATASQLPLQIKPEIPWTKDVRASTVPGEPDAVMRLGRCQLSPDNKIIESRPAPS